VQTSRGSAAPASDDSRPYVAGIVHVGLGSVFDGIEDTVAGLEDDSRFPALLEELARRGWGDEELAKVAGENFLRVLDAADAFEKSARDGHSK
jgi:microsomal dipeptidase-like Zn-dependent dipeptidase